MSQGSMGDPFWRRFGTGKERVSQHYSRERTLASEYANMNTRNGPATMTSGSVGRSRNDLFSTDWKWKGMGEEQQANPWRDGVDGMSSDGLDRALSRSSEPRQRNEHLDVNDPVSEPAVEVMATSTTAEQSLGAPFRLKSPSTAYTPLQAQQSSSGPTRRSRNDTIYNVNHLTITPPRKHAVESVTLAQSPVESSFGLSPATYAPDTGVMADGESGTATRHQTTASMHPVLGGPSRSVSLDSTSSCGDSVITSFTEQAATDPDLAARQVGATIRDRGCEGPVSPVLSPITPDAPHFNSSSSFTQQIDKPVHGTPVSAGWTDSGLQSPRSDLSLSRSSSLNIAQSPSRTLANIKQRAEILLSESEDTNTENSHLAFGSGTAVRVRADIHSRAWLIGYGRYAKVFLGSYQAAATGWNLCAAKVFDADVESVGMARKENAVLRYLHEANDSAYRVEGRPYILKSIALIDETSLEGVPAIHDLSRPCSRTGTPTRRNTLNAADTPTRIASNGPTGNAVRAVYTSHRRSASENTAMLRHLGRSAIEAKSPSAYIPAHRPILLSSFCGNGTMAAFLKRPEAEDGVDDTVWSTWFQQGLAALAWCEEKGVLHNDIKVSLVAWR